MNLLKRTKKGEDGRCTAVTLGRQSRGGLEALSRPLPLGRCELELYDALRTSVPIIDAAICKLVRLVGGLQVECDDPRAQIRLERFLREVKVGPASYGISAFLSAYFDDLLTYGTALGEIVPTADRSGMGALYNANLYDLEIEAGSNPLDTAIFVKNIGGRTPVRDKSLILMSALNPSAGQVSGNSLLKGLPFVSSILMKIFNTVGVNWERLGNVRFAVTCKQDGDAFDRVGAGRRAEEIATAWQNAMSDSGEVRDFVAVGDVEIKVIGADNPVLDSEVPVRQLLEQIVAKLGLPPFMLGLSWSSTERMSSQQADILTSELEYYRSLLEPVVLKICRTWMTLNGFSSGFHVVWNDINLQDEVEEAKAELYRAQARQILAGLEKK